MDKKEIIKNASIYMENANDNYINEKYSISKTIIGTRIFDKPLFSFGAAADGLFNKLKEPAAIGEHFMLPTEWLITAKTVICFFLPFNKKVRASNYIDKKWPSAQWLHGRIEGQELLLKLCLFLKEKIQESGYKSVIPALDSRFWNNSDHVFTSNWSERHAGYVCGLGTFGLSKGLITEKGVAGRFGSIISELYLEPDERKYNNIYEYCNRCGKCTKQCPVNAICLKNGKNHLICSEFLKITSSKYNPRYGCGKCQVNVPCESKIPIR